VHRKANDFCKLILYPATLIKLLMVSRSFWVEFFQSLRYRIISSANRDILTVSLPICIPFISSSCLIGELLLFSSFFLLVLPAWALGFVHLTCVIEVMPILILAIQY
jgi:hypothetical protein